MHICCAAVAERLTPSAKTDILSAALCRLSSLSTESYIIFAWGEVCGPLHSALAERDDDGLHCMARSISEGHWIHRSGVFRRRLLREGWVTRLLVILWYVWWAVVAIVHPSVIVFRG